jgi:hypothetical protein
LPCSARSTVFPDRGSTPSRILATQPLASIYSLGRISTRGLMLAGIDVLVDLQDAGARYFTISGRPVG